MSHPLEGCRFVRQPDGTHKVYNPDGTFRGIARPSDLTWPVRRSKPARSRPSSQRKAAPAAATLPPRVSTGRYVVTPSLRVADEIRRGAQEAADRCADELGIKRRPVRWFDDATSDRLVEFMTYGVEPERFDAEECLGVYRPDVPNAVYVKVTDDVRTAAEVAAHETRHRWQHLTRGAPMRDEQAMYEDDARRYSDEFAARFDLVAGGTPW
jgi:hypothetical protein